MKELVGKVTKAIKKPFSRTGAKQQKLGIEVDVKPAVKAKLPRKEQIIAPEPVKETSVV